MPSVTDPQLLPWLTGPYAALVLALIVIYGLYRLFRDEQKERRSTFDTLQKVTEALKDLSDSVKEANGKRR